MYEYDTHLTTERLYNRCNWNPRAEVVTPTHGVLIVHRQSGRIAQ